MTIIPLKKNPFIKICINKCKFCSLKKNKWMKIGKSSLLQYDWLILSHTKLEKLNVQHVLYYITSWFILCRFYLEMFPYMLICVVHIWWHGFLFLVTCLATCEDIGTWLTTYFAKYFFSYVSGRFYRFPYCGFIQF